MWTVEYSVEFSAATDFCLPCIREKTFTTRRAARECAAKLRKDGIKDGATQGERVFGHELNISIRRVTMHLSQLKDGRVYALCGADRKNREWDGRPVVSKVDCPKCLKLIEAHSKRITSPAQRGES